MSFIERLDRDRSTEYRTKIGTADENLVDPQLCRLFDHWKDIRGDAFAPKWTDFDWYRVPPRLVPHCAVVDVHRDPEDFVYRFWGTGRTSMQGADYTGKSITMFEPRAIALKAIAEYRAVLEARTAVCIDTIGLKNNRAEQFDYQFIRLPFSADGVEVHQILAVGVYNQASMKSALDFYGTNRFRYS